MPRLRPLLFRQAQRQSPHLAALLPGCRDLESAQNELRWITHHVDETTSLSQRAARLASMCLKRGRGVPLQYVLGSQPFGPLDIKCRPGVLIPRSETEAYTYHLAELIKQRNKRRPGADTGLSNLRIIDFCTGTGCIPLLLFALLQTSFKDLEVRGVDISPYALRLAQENIAHNLRLQTLVSPTEHQRLLVTRGDVFSDDHIKDLAVCKWDVLVSNPPYISRDVWNYGRGQLGYSVRKYEPQLALVPDDSLPRPSGCDPADVFYARLLDIAALLSPQIILLEIGDEAQALRVLRLYAQHKIARDSQAELWRDWVDFDPGEDDTRSVQIEDQSGRSWEIPVKGNGRIRSIFIVRPDAESPK